ARAAVAATKGRVGVIATEGTVKSKAYTKAIRALRSDVEVIEAAAPLFVPLAEEGWANTHVAREVAEIYLEPLIDAGIDTLVLGCTHYPILRGTIEQVVGDAVRIVDSAETTAECVRQALGEWRAGGRPGWSAAGSAADRGPRQRRRAAGGPAGEPPARPDPLRQFLVTDAADRFRRVAGEFLEQEIEELELVKLER